MRTALAGLTIASVAVALAPTSGARLLARDGISLRVPDGWHGKVTGTDEATGLELANFRLPVHDPWGQAAIRAVRGAGDELLLLSEVGNRPGSAGFRRAMAPIRVRPRDLVPAGSRPADRQLAARRRFAIGGRSFVLLVYLGSRSRLAQRLRGVDAVLASLRVESYVHPGTWARLRRRLHLPASAAGGGCPRSRSGRAAPSAYFTLGPGPAYPVFGTRDGVAALGAEEWRGGAYRHKTLWAIGPGYRGPVLVRGRRIGGPGELGFSVGGRATSELRLPPSRWLTGWRYVPTTTVIPGSGCYALQIDGNGFSRIVVFSAV